MRAAPLSFHRSLAPEDQARADLYAVLARLYADPPDARFLRALASADRMPGASPVGEAWNRLIDASMAMDADAAAEEYTELFVGVGKCEVNLHASHWITGFMAERPLVELRRDLASLAITRNEAATMLEDHLSAMFETMRILVAGDGDRPPATVEQQGNFLQQRLLSWAFVCCAAIVKSSLANYYGRVAELTEQFLTVERDSLAID